jgi:uncharacterized protein (DUF4213/DUF364 family)
VKNSNHDIMIGTEPLAGRRTVLADSLEEIRSTVPDIEQIKVANVIIGAGYTGVSLSSGQVGLAHSSLDEYSPHCCEIIDRAGHLAGSSALDMARLALSWDIRARVLGVATINAISQLLPDRSETGISTLEGDIADHITVRGDVVTVVGNIRPTIEKLRARAKKIYVLERNPDLRDEETLPDTAAEEIIPQSQVVIITGASITNGTVDRLLELSRNAREVALVGATAGLPPIVLFRHGATAVGTIKVTHPTKVMQVIAEGGGTPTLMDSVKFVVYKRITEEM